MKARWVAIYGLFCYLLFHLSFLYLFAFLLDLGEIRTRGLETTSTSMAIAIDLVLIVLFAAVHSLMARDWFKRWWTRWVPLEAERSTYVLQSSLFLSLAIWQWRPIPVVVWSIESPILQAMCYLGFVTGATIVMTSTFQIDHGELFGVRQALSGRPGSDETSPAFVKPWLYRIVRHPLQFGMITLMFATPRMTAGHLLFAVAMAGYSAIGVQFEERTLVRRFGDAYRDYQRSTPQLIPGLDQLTRLTQRIRGGSLKMPTAEPKTPIVLNSEDATGIHIRQQGDYWTSRT